jgi:hypothetical protein
MSTKIHLTAKENEIDESGVQIRSSDPVAPVADQIWIKSDQRKLKAKIGSETVVLAKGDSATVSLSSNVVDSSIGDTFTFSTDSNVQFSVINKANGQSIKILVTNTSAESISVDFDSLYIFSDDENGEVAANRSKLFSIILIEGELFVQGSNFN